MKDWPISIIPNVLDTDVYKPVGKQEARKILNLPLNSPLLLFGALGGGKDFRKGFDILLDTLNLLKDVDELKSLQCIVFGQGKPIGNNPFPFTTHWLGHLQMI